ncbi:TPM domain-containing protein [Maribacter sp. R77961]|uniref:TPM domain-containing protein n=1 Tax=Maribacter sp. R77961 TaxID=3093871 RepID=UPI0037C6154D
MKLFFQLTILVFLTLSSCKSSQPEKTEPKTDAPKVVFDFSEMKKADLPESIGIINDYGQIFTESQRTELSKILYDYEIETTRQIVVVTVDSIKPYNEIQKYATDLGQKWGVGNAEKDNGLVIVLCNPIREIGIATGTGTELILTDEICKIVIDSTIVPEFKNEKYYNGIKNGVTELIAKWK